MYLIENSLIPNDLLNVQNLLNLLLFLILTFLGVAARISIDIEISKKKLRDIKFFHRYFLATVLAYVIEFFIAERPLLRKYYSEIIILFCIFVNDIVIFIFSNRIKLFNYIIKAITRGAIDLSNSINTPNTKDNDTHNNSSDS